jgi:Tol biopolymer transport system component
MHLAIGPQVQVPDLVRHRRAQECVKIDALVKRKLLHPREEYIHASTPLDRVVQTCVAEAPDERFQSASDLARAIEWSATAPKPGRMTRPWLRWSFAGAAVMALGAIASWRYFDKPAPQESMRFQFPVPVGAIGGTSFDISPDGRKLAYISDRRLWVHSFGTDDSRNLTDASGTPFWSPDSRFIGYPQSGKVMKIEATGGPAQTVAKTPTGWGGGTWNQEGLILFSDGNGGSIFQVPAAGGEAVRIVEIDRGHRDTLVVAPGFLPDGRHFLYTRRRRAGTTSAVYVGTIDTPPEQQSPTLLVNSFWGAHYAPSATAGWGHLLFLREDTLMAQPFDTRSLKLSGRAIPVAERLDDGRAVSVSTNGTLVYEPSNLAHRQLTWYDRTGTVLGTVGQPAWDQAINFSPDGRTVALNRATSGQLLHVTLLNPATGAAERFGPDSSSYAVWSPDGSSLAFSYDRDGVFDLYEAPLNRATAAQALFKSDVDKLAMSWSPDGRFLLFAQNGAKTKRDLWLLPMQGDRTPIPFLVTPANETNARFSPDGRWLAYQSDESGNYELYVRPFKLNAAETAVEPGGKWQVSNGGGYIPAWRHDGRELYYASGEFVYRAELAPGPELKVLETERLEIPLPQSAAFSVSPDGKRFLVVAPDDKPQPITVVVNWQAGLK